MFDRVGTPDLRSRCAIVSHTLGTNGRETQSHARSKPSRRNLCFTRGALTSRGHASSTSQRRTAMRLCAVGSRPATKSVATEYYRPNIEDCGEPVACLNKRRIFTQIWTSVGLRRATDEHMQNGHDCESEFGSTSENGRQRWVSARPAIRTTTSPSASSSVGGSPSATAPPSAEPSSCRGAAFGRTGTPSGQSATASAQA